MKGPPLPSPNAPPEGAGLSIEEWEALPDKVKRLICRLHKEVQFYEKKRKVKPCRPLTGDRPSKAPETRHPPPSTREIHAPRHTVSLGMTASMEVSTTQVATATLDVTTDDFSSFDLPRTAQVVQVLSKDKGFIQFLSSVPSGISCPVDRTLYRLAAVVFTDTSVAELRQALADFHGTSRRTKLHDLLAAQDLGLLDEALSAHLSKQFGISRRSILRQIRENP